MQGAKGASGLPINTQPIPASADPTVPAGQGGTLPAGTAPKHRPPPGRGGVTTPHREQADAAPSSAKVGQVPAELGGAQSIKNRTSALLASAGGKLPGPLGGAGGGKPETKSTLSKQADSTPHAAAGHTPGPAASAGKAVAPASRQPKPHIVTAEKLRTLLKGGKISLDPDDKMTQAKTADTQAAPASSPAEPTKDAGKPSDAKSKSQDLQAGRGGVSERAVPDSLNQTDRSDRRAGFARAVLVLGGEAMAPELKGEVILAAAELFLLGAAPASPAAAGQAQAAPTDQMLAGARRYEGFSDFVDVLSRETGLKSKSADGSGYQEFCALCVESVRQLKPDQQGAVQWPLNAALKEVATRVGASPLAWNRQSGDLVPPPSRKQNTMMYWR